MSKPIVLCVIEGLGISSSWKGNAVASANPKNFYDLFLSYKHQLLLTSEKIKTVAEFDDRNSCSNTLLSGMFQSSEREILNKEIASGLITNNSKINCAFEQVLKSNSALHLIGNLSGSKGEFGDMSHLISLLQLAKQRDIFRVYIHLILDDSSTRNLDEALSTIHLLAEKIEPLGIGEIASLNGMKYLEDGNDSKLGYVNFIRALKAIIEGKGNIYLSPQQAISQAKTKITSPREMPPSTISFKGRPIGVIHDLDSVIFFNHNNSTLLNLVNSFCAGSVEKNSFLMPKFLNVTLFFNNALMQNPKLNIAYESKNQESLINILSKNNISTGYVCDNFSTFFPKDSLNQENGSEFILVPAPSLESYYNDSKTSALELFKQGVNLINKNHQLIIIDIPLIDVAANVGGFNQAVKATKAIDELLPVLAKKILDVGGKLILTSSYGNAEKMVHRNDYETLNKRTQSPVPFVLVSNESKLSIPAKSIENEIMYDIIRKKNYITDITPTVLDLLELPIPAEMTGKSLI